MRYSVCLPAVYCGVPSDEAVRRIAAIGAERFEIWGWWEIDLDALERAMVETGLKMVAMCVRPTPLNDPDCREACVEAVRESIAVAKRFNCPALLMQVGQMRENIDREEQHASIVEGLKACAPLAEEAGITLLPEPLNILVDHKGYYLDSSVEGFEIIREVGSPNVKLLYDIYHQQITEGQLIANITANIDLIGHFHVAGVPGRHEPFEDQEINYPAVLTAIRKAGYQGAVGLEYFPLSAPEESLKRILSGNL